MNVLRQGFRRLSY